MTSEPTSTFGSFNFSPALQGATGGSVNAFGGANVSAPPTNIAGANNENVSGSSSTSSKTATMVAPYYESIFLGGSLWNQLKSLAEESCQHNEAGKLAGQQLIQYVRESNNCTGIARYLFNPQSIEYRKPDFDLRRRLSMHPTVILIDADRKEREAILTEPIYRQLCHLSDSLFISEEEALSLFFYVSTHTDLLTDLFLNGFNDDNGGRHAEENIARSLFFYERSSFLRTILLLLQLRQQSIYVAEATDVLLQGELIPKLVHRIRDYTSLCQQLLQKREQLSYDVNAAALLDSTPNSTNKKQYDNLQDHLDFCHRERQVAAECLFFAAYDVQLTVNEIVSILDLIKDLSNGSSSDEIGLRKLDALRDVPNPYEVIQDEPQTFTSTMNRTSWHQQRKEKNALEWQHQLVDTVHKTGYPDLLRCISTLIVTCMSAFDTHNVLSDRNTHDKNSFGKGNAILPNNSESVAALTPIDIRLNEDAVKLWKRPDVLGLLMASYTMLLGSSPMITSSLPVGEPSFTAVRKTLLYCLRRPPELKSFTFARVSLIPALKIPVLGMTTCDVSSFLLGCLAEFTSRYLNLLCSSGELPMSRAKWKQDAEDQLRLQRLNEDRQRQFHGEFHVGPATSNNGISSVPEDVNILERPDCLDDVVSWAVSVCLLDSEYSMRFWSTEEYIDDTDGTCHVKLSPNPLLIEMHRQQSSDPSLRPVYFSFLATLAIARHEDLNGAEVINQLLSGLSLFNNDVHSQSWASIFDTLRYYVRELNPNVYPMHRATNVSESRGISSGISTAYYYLEEQDDNVTDRNTNSETSNANRSGMAAKELGEENTTILISHLAIIANVARNFPLARSTILSTYLPIPNADQQVITQTDDPLNILFTLSIMPLHPEVRGKVFTTLSWLLSSEGLLSDTEILDSRKVATRGWELLDACQVVPTHVLQQYGAERQSVSGSVGGLSFPPSSVSVAAERKENYWIPTDPRYSILYEMEYVESSMGSYPSTEGFLQLLLSLFNAGSCVSFEENNWNVQGGCTPYAEYVVKFVLPRAIGSFMTLQKLPFRKKEDFNRLLSYAFKVLNCILTRYCLPVDGALMDAQCDFFEALRSSALCALGSSVLVDSVTAVPFQDDAIASLRDFNHNTRIENDTTSTRTALHRPFANPDSSLNSVKSPGFTVLCDLLMPSGNVLRAIAETLLQAKTPVSVAESDRFAVAIGLYGDTVPTWKAAKEAVNKRNISNYLYEALLIPIFVMDDIVAPTRVQTWDEVVVAESLKVLCSAIARENLWSAAVTTAHHELVIVPYLNLERKSIPSTTRVTYDSLAQQLKHVDSKIDILSTIIRHVKESHIDETLDANIALASTAILFYLDQSLRQRSLMDSTEKLRTAVASAFGRRMLMCAEQNVTQPKTEWLKLTVEKVVQTLRSTNISTDTLAVAMLGLPSTIDDAVRRFSGCTRPSQDNCFDALLVLLKRYNFVAEAFSEIATVCYEILYHLTRVHDYYNHAASSVQLFSILKLRNDGFWEYQFRMMSFILHKMPSPCHIHSAAWLLKSVASEMLALSGLYFGSHCSELSCLNPVQFENLSNSLFQAGGVIEQFLLSLPLEKSKLEGLSFQLPEQVVTSAKEPLPGAPDIVQGYEIIQTEKLLKAVSGVEYVAVVDTVKRWADQYNNYVQLDCASAHLSYAIYVTVGASVISFKSEALQHYSDAHSGLTLLMMILSRFQRAVRGSFDEHLFGPASRNLALALRIATTQACPIDVTYEGKSIELTSACIMLAKAIVCSGTGIDDTIVRDRTTAFVCSISMLINSMSNDQLTNDFFSEFVSAAPVLARLAGTTSNSISLHESLVARTALSLMLGKLDYEVADTCQAVWESLRDNIKELISLIPRLDYDIANLMASIASLPFGVEFLIDNGIMESLNQAATNYLVEEERFLNDTILSSTGDRLSHLSVPTFFVSHLSLMNVMMVSKPGRGNMRNMLSSNVLAVLKRYKSVITRLFQYFPVDLDVLHELLKCLSQIKMMHDELQTDTGRLNNGLHKDSTLSDFEVHIARVLTEVAENPLPLNMLPSIPVPISEHSKPQGYALISDVAKCSSWWDALDLKGKVSIFRDKDAVVSENICNLACAVIDLMKPCFYVLRGKQVLQHIQLASFCRALCRCIKTVRLTDSLLVRSKSEAHASIGGNSDYLLEFETKLADFIIDLLILTIDKVHTLPIENSGENSRLLRLTLDFCALDKSGLALSRLPANDENRIDLAFELGLSLRQELTRRREGTH